MNTLLEEAEKLLAVGQPEDALTLCERILAAEPDHCEALYTAGRIDLQSGRTETALQRFATAAQLDPDNALYAQYLGISYGTAGKLAEAEQHFRRVVALAPDNAFAQMNLGNVLKDQGKFSAAADAFRQSITLAEENAEAWLELGNVLRKLGDTEAAISAFKSALSNRPSLIRANLPLAAALLDAGRVTEATTLLEKLTGEFPRGAELFDYLGQARMANGDFTSAIDSYRQAIRINPRLARAGNNLGHACLSAWQPEAAIESFRAALQQKPDYARAHSNLLQTMNYLPDISSAALFTEAKRFGEQHDRKMQLAGQTASRESGHRIRLGYLSPDFRSHSIAHFTARLIGTHDRSRFELYLYSAVTKPDQITATFEQQCDHWRSITNLSDEAAANVIHADGIDILVDLAGHTANNRLPVFGYRPAPVQVTWLGYPNTTGMDSIDYRLTDDIADPPGTSDEFHTERLLRLDAGFLCYQTSNPEPAITDAPCVTNGHITFGSFNHLPKLNERVIRLWARILQRLPDARLLLKSRSLVNDDVRAACAARFAAAGVSPERLLLRQMTPSRRAHMAMYGEVDIALDTFPYNGTTTTCEALWMGVPVITLAGERHAGRVGVSILQHAGCAAFIAENEDDYVERACALAGDRDRLAQVRADLRQQLLASELMDVTRFTRSLEAVYDDIAANPRSA